MRGSLVASMVFAPIAAFGPANPSPASATRVVMLGTGLRTPTLNGRDPR